MSFLKLSKIEKNGYHSSHNNRSFLVDNVFHQLNKYCEDEEGPHYFNIVYTPYHEHGTVDTSYFPDNILKHYVLPFVINLSYYEPTGVHKIVQKLNHPYVDNDITHFECSKKAFEIDDGIPMDRIFDHTEINMIQVYAMNYYPMGNIGNFRYQSYHVKDTDVKLLHNSLIGQVILTIIDLYQKIGFITDCLNHGNILAKVADTFNTCMQINYACNKYGVNLYGVQIAISVYDSGEIIHNNNTDSGLSVICSLEWFLQRFLDLNEIYNLEKYRSCETIQELLDVAIEYHWIFKCI
jgi:hypothetical protein